MIHASMDLCPKTVLFCIDAGLSTVANMITVEASKVLVYQNLFALPPRDVFITMCQILG